MPLDAEHAACRVHVDLYPLLAFLKLASEKPVVAGQGCASDVSQPSVPTDGRPRAAIAIVETSSHGPQTRLTRVVRNLLASGWGPPGRHAPLSRSAHDMHFFRCTGGNASMTWVNSMLSIWSVTMACRSSCSSSTRAFVHALAATTGRNKASHRLSQHTSHDRCQPIAESLLRGLSVLYVPNHSQSDFSQQGLRPAARFAQPCMTMLGLLDHAPPWQSDLQYW